MKRVILTTLLALMIGTTSAQVIRATSVIDIERQERLAKKIEAQRIAEANAEKRRNLYAEMQKGFGSIVDVSYKVGLKSPYSSVGLTYTAGYKFNNLIYLGAGVGANINIGAGPDMRSIVGNYTSDLLNPHLVSVPVFAYFRANFIDRRCSPFFALAAGGNFSPKQTLHLDLYDVKYNTIGMFANPQLGVNFRTTTKTSIYLAVGFQCFTAPSCVEFTGYNAAFKPSLGYGLDFHLGFTF